MHVMQVYYSEEKAKRIKSPKKINEYLISFFN